jgi:hypothetical protein
MHGVGLRGLVTGRQQSKLFDWLALVSCGFQGRIWRSQTGALICRRGRLRRHRRRPRCVSDAAPSISVAICAAIRNSRAKHDNSRLSLSWRHESVFDIETSLTRWKQSLASQAANFTRADILRSRDGDDPILRLATRADEGERLGFLGNAVSRHVLLEVGLVSVC